MPPVYRSHQIYHTVFDSSDQSQRPVQCPIKSRENGTCCKTELRRYYETRHDDVRISTLVYVLCDRYVVDRYRSQQCLHD